MKFTLLLLLLSISYSAIAQTCNVKVDPSKIILFVDTNRGEPEIAVAQKAACARGERLVVLPKGKNESKTPIKELLEKELNAIKASHGKIQSMIISGHDGGGHFGGDKGDITRQELDGIVSGYPDEVKEVKSLLLLGCYTGVPKEVLEWKKIFPDVRLIAGYDGSGPLADKPLGHQYITEILTKEKQLVAQADQKKLEAFVNANIKSLEGLNSALYLRCDEDPNINPDEESKEYYYSSIFKERGLTEFSVKDCETKKVELDGLIAQVEKYNSGELEPPLNTTASGELRKIYNHARAVEHCAEILKMPLNLNHVFNLLFYDGVKKNFAHYYKEELAEVENLVQQTTSEEIDKIFSESISGLSEQVKSNEQILGLFDTNPEAYVKAKKDAALKKADQAIEDFKVLIPSISELNLEEKATQEGFDLNQYPPGQQRSISVYVSLLEQKRLAARIGANLGEERAKIQADVQTSKSNLAQKEERYAKFKAAPDKFFNFWIPTAKNLEKKSRKEALANLHHMTEALENGELPAKLQQKLSSIKNLTAARLQQFDNPFSWHEYTGEMPEKPGTMGSEAATMGSR